MVQCRYRATAMLSAALTLASCGGSGSSSPPVAPTVPTPVTVVTTGDNVRLAKQASFGPTQALADHIAAIGTSGWLDEQFAASGSNYNDLVGRAVTE